MVKTLQSLQPQHPSPFLNPSRFPLISFTLMPPPHIYIFIAYLLNIFSSVVRLVRRRLLRGPPPSSLNMSSTADALTVTNFGTFPLDVVITIVLVGCPDILSVFVTICKELQSIYRRCRHEIIISCSSIVIFFLGVSCCADVAVFYWLHSF